MTRAFAYRAALGALAAGIAAVAWTASARIEEGVADVIDNVRLPLAKHVNGRVKTLLRARRATLPTVNTVQAEGVVVEMYDEVGVLVGILTSEDVAVDQRRNRGHGNGAVRFEHKGVIIEGIGMTWESNESLVRIESNAVVRLERAGAGLVEGWK